MHVCMHEMGSVHKLQNEIAIMEWNMYVDCSAIMHECKHGMEAACDLQHDAKRHRVLVENGKKGGGTKAEGEFLH